MHILLKSCLAYGFSAVLSSSPLLAQDVSNKAVLGEHLFFDTELSANGTQSCSTCHDPEHGFIDTRDNGANAMASLGDNGSSLGDRNAPSAAYAAFAPAFHKNDKGAYVGGMFHDGRATTLKDQAGGPPLNPDEMGMSSKDAVLNRLKQNPDYVVSFKKIYGQKVLKDADTAYTAITDAIAAFEKTDRFSPFDSKYDRFLRGEMTLSDQEELGRVLFFSQQFTNCNICHQLRTSPGAEREVFTNYEYHNIGVPTNTALRKLNGVDTKAKDLGLFLNPNVDDPKQKGKFKTPSLRNVAVTGPYMHNGVFKDLRTVIKFYNKYNSLADAAQINPETGEDWGAPEVDQNISLKELKTGPALKSKRIDALVAFLKTLTDKRYEHLLTP